MGREGCRRCWTPQMGRGLDGEGVGQGGNCLPTVRTWGLWGLVGGGGGRRGGDVPVAETGFVGEGGGGGAEIGQFGGGEEGGDYYVAVGKELGGDVGGGGLVGHFVGE